MGQPHQHEGTLVAKLQSRSLSRLRFHLGWKRVDGRSVRREELPPIICEPKEPLDTLEVLPFKEFLT